MGVISDQEIVQMVGTEDMIMTKFSASLGDIIILFWKFFIPVISQLYLTIKYFYIEECHRAKVYTQDQALKFIGSKMRQRKYFGGPKRTPVDDARGLIANTLLAHVPVVNFNFKMKALYLALMVRRIIEAEGDPEALDDRWKFVTVWKFNK